MSHTNCIILLGPSCSGKKEIGLVLEKLYQISPTAYLEMGSLLRGLLNAQKEESDFTSYFLRHYGERPNTPAHQLADKYQFVSEWNTHAQHAAAWSQKTAESVTIFDWVAFCVDQGLLVPNFITCGSIEAGLEKAMSTEPSMIFVDGYPRRIAAAEDLMERFEKRKIRFVKCLHFFISFHTMIERAMARGRHDDHSHALIERYDFYLESVLPTIDWLKKEFGSQSVSLIDAHHPDCSRTRSIQKNIYATLKILLDEKLYPPS